MNLEAIARKITELELLRDTWNKRELERSEERKRRDHALKTQKVLRLMQNLGVKLSDLDGYTESMTQLAPPKTRMKVAPKYRDEATGDTWSGRGKQPRWLMTKLAHGAHDLSEFEIKTAA